MSIGGDAALADWPMARHDVHRTSLAVGQSDIVRPAAYWRYYLGGGLSAKNFRFLDVDGDAGSEGLLVAGGRVVVKTPSDQLIWQTEPLEISSIVGVADLDGDGVDELVLHSMAHVYVIDLETGEVLWRQPEGEVGAIQAVRLGNLDGRGGADLVISENSCSTTSTGNTGLVYSFEGGWSDARVLWPLPWKSCSGGLAVTVVDMDGDGRSELLLPTESAPSAVDTLALLDGRSGELLDVSAPIASWVQRSECLPDDLDGLPGDELVCIMNASFPPGVDQRKAFALGYTGDSLHVLWEQSLAPDVGGDVRYIDPVADLDHDGRKEVVVSRRNAAGVWTTMVLDAVNGQLLATIQSAFVSGIAQLEADRTLVLTQSETTTAAWAFTRGATSPVSLRWVLPDRSVLSAPDPSRLSISAASMTTLASDLDGDGIADLLTQRASAADLLRAYSATSGSPRAIASYVPSGDARIAAAWLVGDPGDPGRVAVAQANGFLHLLTDELIRLPTGDDVNQLGIRMGGYYASGLWDLQRVPVTATLSAGAPDAILVPDTQRALLRLDASLASMVMAPQVSWRRATTVAPTVVAELGGIDRAIVAIESVQPGLGDPEYRLVVMDGEGELQWSSDLDTMPLNDAVPGDFDADGAPELVLQWGSPSDTLVRTEVRDGLDGRVLWESPAIEPQAGRQMGGVAVADWNGDGADDVYFQAAGTRVLSGLSGAELAYRPGPAYFHPTLLDLDGDGAHAVVLHGGTAPARMLEPDLSSHVWLSSEDDRPYQSGAIAHCPDGARYLVEGSFRYRARLKMTRLDRDRAGQTRAVVLAGGQLFDSEAAASAAGHPLGLLTPASSHSNLTGTGRPSTLVGSSDGYLYAIDPCTGELDFSHYFGAAVGQPIFGDTDADGRDEILVTSADGYLYALKNEAIAAPEYVWDIDPQAGIVDQDVSSTTSRSQLAARWAAVEGATGYAIAVVTSNADFLTQPPWQEVGLATEITIPAQLEEGVLYRFAVRALSPDGPSVDAVSNGVLLRRSTGDDGPSAQPEGSEGSGCGCSVRSESGTAVGSLLWAGLVLLALRRRRAKRSRGCPTGIAPPSRHTD